MQAEWQNQAQGRRLGRRATVLISALVAVLVMSVAPAGGNLTRLVVEFAESAPSAETLSFMDELSVYVGAPVSHLRDVGGGEHILALPASVDGTQLDRVLKRLKRHKTVISVRTVREGHARFF